MSADPARTARVLHLALTGGCVALAGVFTALGTTGAFGPRSLPATVQWAAAPGVLVFWGLRVLLIRRMWAPEDTSAWWAAHLPAALVIWALEEGWFLIGVVLWVLSGGSALLLLAGAGFGMLLWDRPGRLAGVS